MLLDYTLNQFINYNIFLGYSKKQTLQTSYIFLLGLRKKITIIKLSNSIYNCKVFFQFLSKFFNKFGGLWYIFRCTKTHNILKNSIYFFIKKFLDLFKNMQLMINYRILGWFLKWRPGILTNYKNWRQNKMLNFTTQNFWYPNSILYLNLDSNLSLQKEPNKIGIIGLNISDTSISHYQNNYIIPGNEKTFLNLFFYFKLILNFIIRNFFLYKIVFKNNNDL